MKKHRSVTTFNAFNVSHFSPHWVDRIFTVRLSNLIFDNTWQKNYRLDKLSFNIRSNLAKDTY